MSGIIRPSTGSGSSSNTYGFDVGDLAQGESFLITHESVPIPSERIFFDGELVKRGLTNQYDNISSYFQTYESGNDENWEWEDISGSITTYTHQTTVEPYSGKFNAPVTSKIVAGTRIIIGSSYAHIISITGDGTGDNSVVLDTNFAEDTYTITRFQNATFAGNGFAQTYTYSGGNYYYPTGFWTWAYTKLPVDFDFTKVKNYIGLSSSYASLTVDMVGKFAFSNDGGTTIKYLNGVSGEWETMTLADWETKGCLFYGGWFQDSEGNTITAEALEAFGFNTNTILYCAYKSNDSIYQFVVNYFRVEYDANDEHQIIGKDSVTIGMSGSRIKFERISETQLKISNTDNMGTILRDIFVKILIED